VPPGSAPQAGGSAALSTDVNTDFSTAGVGDTVDVWNALFQAMGSRYDPPKLVLFRGKWHSACGSANAAMGPFYCPADQKLYLDTSFFNELHTRFGAPGDFAQAYVIAHEVGHHVQNLLGTMRQFDAQRQRSDERTANMLSVRLELQADCYAGVWGFYAQKRGKIDANDIESGLRAAAAVGDDQIQKRTTGYVVPESFTHGSAEQRARWFRTGLQSGDPRDCNTFNAR
jgi:predicted metalloprotease